MKVLYTLGIKLLNMGLPKVTINTIFLLVFVAHLGCYDDVIVAFANFYQITHAIKLTFRMTLNEIEMRMEGE